MWYENKSKRTSFTTKLRQSFGFTLLEMVMALTIVGFMTVAVGSGIVYGVKIYKATEGANAVMPQVATTLNVLRHLVMREGHQGLDKVTLNKGVLSLDGSPILRHVQGYKVDKNASVDGTGSLTRITLTLEPDVIGSAHTLTVEVAND